MVHPAKGISIGCSDESAGNRPTALLLKNLKKVPFPECPPPDYITGFGHKIQINFLDHQVLTFFSLIAARLTTSKLCIRFTTELSHIDENQLACVNRLFQIIREKSIMSRAYFDCNLSSLQFLADVDNNMKRIECYGTEQSNIPILMQFLASSRPDGQQRVVRLFIPEEQLITVLTLFDAIKKEFRTATQPLPQPFYILFHIEPHFNIPQSEEQNLQTEETLTMMPYPPHNWDFYICRHPRGQHEHWAADARPRLIAMQADEYESTTFINVDISEFGDCTSPWIQFEEK